MRKLAVLLLAACGGGGESAPDAMMATNHAPVADLSAGGTIVAGRPLAFDGSASSDPDGDSLRYSWSFGDGGRGGTAQLAHVFAQAGTFTVTLTVSDGRGAMDSIARDVVVSAAPPPTAMVTAMVRVSSAAGEPLAGATVRVLGGADATTDAAGLATLAIGAGARQVLRVDRAGYTRQTQALELPAEDAFIDVVLQPLADALVLDDATAGGDVAGTDGARVELPAGALVDEAGAPVSGAVDVTMTPVDVVAAGAAFPGKFEGVTPTGEAAPIMSWGTVSFSFQKDGRRLNLAADQAATIELPLYASLNLDGSPVGAGDVFPLWSLDEATGEWIQEGQGTVVASAGSPTGFALRGEVGHFSWWNCDSFAAVHHTATKCCIDGNFDGECDGDTICYVRGRTDCPSYLCNAAKPDDVLGKPPAFSPTTVIPAGATQSLPMPSAFPILLEGFAENGTKYGRAVVYSTTDAATIVLAPAEEPLPTQMITLPWSMPYTSGAPGTFARFTFDGTAATTILIQVSRSDGSQLEGTVTLKGPTGVELRGATFAATPAGMTVVLPTTGRYTIEVNPSKNEPGGYVLEAKPLTDEMVVTGRSPAPAATGVGANAPIVVTFSHPVRVGSVNESSFRVIAPAGDAAGTRVVSGDTVTFTPSAPLTPGVTYRVALTTSIRDATLHPLVPDEWTFQTAEVVGTVAQLTPYGLLGGGAFAGDESMVLITQSLVDSQIALVGLRYVPGQGWGPAATIDSVPSGASLSSPVVAAAGAGLATAAWVRRTSAMSSIYASHFNPASGWSPPELVATQTTVRDLTVATDAQGRGLLAWWAVVQGPVNYSRYDGSWSAPALLAPEGAYPVVAMNGHGDAAAIYVASGYTNVARFDGDAATWSAAEPAATSGNGLVGIDDAGDVFVTWEGGVRRWDASAKQWDAIHATAGHLGALAVSGDGTAVIAYFQGQNYVGFPFKLWGERWDGAAWGAARVLEDNLSQYTVSWIRAAADASGDAAVFWFAESSSAPTRYSRFEAGAWATETPETFSGVQSTSGTVFAMSPHRKLMIVGAPYVSALRLK